MKAVTPLCASEGDRGLSDAISTNVKSSPHEEYPSTEELTDQLRESESKNPVSAVRPSPLAEARGTDGDLMESGLSPPAADPSSHPPAHPFA